MEFRIINYSSSFGCPSNRASARFGFLSNLDSLVKHFLLPFSPRKDLKKA
jgi:hypothetical protein